MVIPNHFFCHRRTHLPLHLFPPSPLFWMSLRWDYLMLLEISVYWHGWGKRDSPGGWSCSSFLLLCYWITCCWRWWVSKHKCLLSHRQHGEKRFGLVLNCLVCAKLFSHMLISLKSWVVGKTMKHTHTGFSPPETHLFWFYLLCWLNDRDVGNNYYNCNCEPDAWSIMNQSLSIIWQYDDIGW